MSEMIKSSDVEDVLFSIRRLVSDTPNEKSSVSSAEAVVTETAARATAVEAPNAGALFLSSALRVNDPATEPEQIDLEEMTKGLPHFRDAITRDDASTTSLLSLDEVFAVKSDGPRRLHLSEVVSDVAAKVDHGYFEDEDTGSLSDRKWSEDPDVDTLGEFATREDTFGSSSEEEVDENPTASEDVAQEVCEVEAADIVTDEPAEDLIEDLSDTVEEAIVEDVAKEVEEVLEAGATDGLANFDENILDEDALRDMVTDIVREELSGELGERITRNVRKLVRREIHRALMTREFD